jgi:hypothetical protein
MNNLSHDQRDTIAIDLSILSGSNQPIKRIGFKLGNGVFSVLSHR